MIFGGLVTHLSVKACQRCFEEVLLFSPLFLDSHPKSSIYPKSFNTLKPTDDYVTLHFYPSEIRKK